jgi:hypothetical protein
MYNIFRHENTYNMIKHENKRMAWKHTPFSAM